MNVYQKIILGIGAIALIIVIAKFPAKYPQSILQEGYQHSTRKSYITIYRTDIGATSLRGLAVIGATAAAWLITGKKKAD